MVHPAPGPAPGDSVPARRLGQLTYTSYQPPSGPAGSRPGGWQIKQQSGGLTTAERELVNAAILTDLRAPAPLSRFPTRAELDQRPRRLLFLATDRIAVYCASINAGPDASGRPDNVFNHVVIDRTPDALLAAEPPMRPVEMWGSGHWLSPYGADEVQEAVFDPDRPPDRSDAVSRPDVVRFVFDPGSYRFGTLAFLLDVVAGTLRGGRRVVLAASTSLEGADWVAAISFLTAPRTCLRLSFSTYGRLGTPASVRPVLSVVPFEDVRDLTASPSDEVVIVEPAEEPDLHPTETGEVWVNRLGQQTPVTDWSRLVLDTCAHGAATFAEVLATADRISRVCDRAAEDEPGWPIAVAVAQREDLRASWPAAARILLRGPDPAGLGLPDDVVQTLQRVIMSLQVNTAAEAWALVESVHAGALFRVAHEHYLGLALGDEKWLCGQEPAPVQSLHQGSPEALAAAATVTEFLSSHEVPPDPVHAARLLDFCAQVLSAVGPPDECPSMARLADAVIDGLRNSVPDVINGTGPLSADAARCLGVLLVGSGGVPGDQLSAELAGWLWLGYADEVQSVTAETAATVAPVVQELLVWSCRDGEAFAQDHRVAAALAVLSRLQPSPGASGPRTLGNVVDNFGGETDWSGAELIQLARMIPSQWVGELVELVTASLYEGPWTEQRGRLARVVRDRAAQATVPADALQLYAMLVEDWFLDHRGFPPRAIGIVRVAARYWPYASPVQRRLIGPHLVVAAYQVVVARDCPRPRDEAKHLRNEVEYQKINPALPANLAAGAWAEAAGLLRQAFRQHELLMEQAVALCATLLTQNERDSLLLVRPPQGDDWREDGADFTSMILEPLLLGYPRDRLVELGERVAAAVPLPRNLDEFDQWWTQLIPAGTRPGRLGRVAQVLRPKSSGGTRGRRRRGDPGPDETSGRRRQ